MLVNLSVNKSFQSRQRAYLRVLRMHSFGVLRSWFLWIWHWWACRKIKYLGVIIESRLPHSEYFKQRQRKLLSLEYHCRNAYFASCSKFYNMAILASLHISSCFRNMFKYSESLLYKRNKIWYPTSLEYYELSVRTPKVYSAYSSLQSFYLFI